MATFPIKIKKINTDHTLELSDHGRTEAEPGDIIMWLIENNSGVAAITSILPKKNSPNVFKPDPGPVGHSSNWKGTVDPDIITDTDERYSIGYKTTGGDNFVFDPIISIKPSR